MSRYFKGYYFKCCEDGRTAAFIPALHTDGQKRGASLQVITKERSYTLPYPDIAFGKNGLRIKIGKNRFSERGLRVDAQTDGCSIKGRLEFGDLKRVKYDIMGPFAYVPFMQCRHCVESMRHSVRGWLEINGEEYFFKNGTGYIEGDSGRSFPEKYVWTQCFFDRGSLMLAVADIPLAGFCFKGIIGAVMIDGHEYRLATYLGAALAEAGCGGVTIRQGKYVLYAKMLKENPRRLLAPEGGRMTRTIHESAACQAYYRFSCNGRVLLEFVSETASFEYEM